MRLDVSINQHLRGYSIFIRKPFLLNFRNDLKSKQKYDYLTDSKIKTSSTLSTNENNKIWLNNLEESIGSLIEDVNLNIEKVANKMSITPTHLNRKMKSLTRFTTKKYIEEIRLLNARTMIENKEVDTVKAAAYSVGFKSVRAFSKKFKARFGDVPSQFLKN